MFSFIKYYIVGVVNILSIRKRQQYLKNLGFYKGMIDGVEGVLTRKA